MFSIIALVIAVCGSTHGREKRYSVDEIEYNSYRHLSYAPGHGIVVHEGRQMIFWRDGEIAEISFVYDENPRLPTRVGGGYVFHYMGMLIHSKEFSVTVTPYDVGRVDINRSRREGVRGLGLFIECCE